MDKKLKKIIKKNFNKDLVSENKSKTSSRKPEASSMTWEISSKKNSQDNKDLNASMRSNDSNSLSENSNNIESHPYLPLRDVPMHDLVKKLQREFEMEGNMNNLLPDMNNLWLK